MPKEVKPAGKTDVGRATEVAFDQARTAKVDALPAFLQGAKLLRGIRLKVNDTIAIPHGLGRKPTGFMLWHAYSFNTLGVVGPDPCRPHTTEHLYVRCEGWAPMVDLVVA